MSEPTPLFALDELHPNTTVDATIVLEAMAAQAHTHRHETRRLAAQLLAHRQLLTDHNIQPPDDAASELALIQFARFRNALEHVLVWFDANGGVPAELRPYFTGTILT